MVDLSVWLLVSLHGLLVSRERNRVARGVVVAVAVVVVVVVAVVVVVVVVLLGGNDVVCF